MNKLEFNAVFAAFIDTIREAETVTRRELGAMSITLIRGIHGIGDAAMLLGELDYVNRLMLVLTPMHRKLLVSYFKHFAGYNFDDKLKVFTKKNKSHYMEALAQAHQLLAGKGVKAPGGGDWLIEPKMEHNIWGWAEHLRIEEPKVFNPDKVSKFVKAQIGLAQESGLDKLDVLAAVFGGGFTAADVAGLMERIAAKQAADGVIDKAKQEPAKVGA